MIDNKSPDRNRLINGVLIAIALTLLAASVYSVYSAWRTGLAQSRAETASRLMSIRTSPRSTETPGINAWVSWSLLNHLDPSTDEAIQLRRWVVPRTDNQFPQEFRPLLAALRKPIPDHHSAVEFRSDADLGGQAARADLEFRNVNYVKCRDQLLVLTARDNASVQSGLGQFAAQAATHLIDIKDCWIQAPQLPTFDAVERIRSARVARIYVLNEDESFLSLPLATYADRADTHLYLSEGDEFRKNPLSPSFVSNKFFFNFQFEQPLDEQVFFSGMYLDLGGLGLVASVVTPVVYEGKRSILGADIAFDIDWEQFAQELTPNLISQVVHVKTRDSASWNPWSEFYDSLPARPKVLKNELQELAERESISTAASARKSVYLANTSSGANVLGIQVNRSTWLLMLVPAHKSKLPWATMLLTGAVFLSLLVRIEQSRRNAVGAQQAAHDELQEKQNLLDTMQVPLMVVDPNTDEIAFCNRAAEAIGMAPGTYFGKDVVSVDLESQEHYRQTQTLGKEPRRAYGIPIRTQTTSSVDGAEKEEVRHAIVRSVAVTAPIESLKADQRHRLGILFLVDEQFDLPILLHQRLAATRQDEKRLLSGLMNHGMDSLARILCSQLGSLTNRPAMESNLPDHEFSCWLSRYLSDRIQLLSWMLENWEQTPSSAEQRMIERETVLRTIQQHNHVFKIVSQDRHLREQLHWNNGLISSSASSAPDQSIIQAKLDWDSDTCFAVPRDGVFGFFLSEAFINAVRHGKAGSCIEFEVTQERVRNTLTFTVTNSVNPVSTTTNRSGLKALGGIQIMQELARLCGWSAPNHQATHDTYSVSWSAPAIRRKMNHEGD